MIITNIVVIVLIIVVLIIPILIVIINGDSTTIAAGNEKASAATTMPQQGSTRHPAATPRPHLGVQLQRVLMQRALEGLEGEMFQYTRLITHTGSQGRASGRAGAGGGTVRVLEAKPHHCTAKSPQVNIPAPDVQ